MVKPTGISKFAEKYLGAQDPRHPHASPNFADMHALPPLLIHVGSDEVLLDDAVKLHDQALADGVASTLEIWDGMIHVWHAFHPMLAEGRQGIERSGSYLRAQWAAA
jgi:acetyl esterase/lipase